MNQSIQINRHLLLDLTSNRMYNPVKQNYKKIEPLLVQIIAYFVERQGQLVSRDDLIERFWGVGVNADETLTQAIAKIRKLIEDSNKEIIITIPKLGYKWQTNSNFLKSNQGFERIDNRQTLKKINGIAALIVVYLIFRFFFHPH